MDINNKENAVDADENSKKGNRKPRVTFQLSLTDNNDKTEENREMKTYFSNDERNDKHRFKRKVSELMQQEDTWRELTKDLPEDDKVKKDFASVTQYLLKKSSIYAVSQVGHAESSHRKILWLLVLIAGLFGCGYEIYRFLILYFEYPVVINLDVENKQSLEFPAITFCNLNRMQKKYETCLEYDKPTKKCKGLPNSNMPKALLPDRKKVASGACSTEVTENDKYFSGKTIFLSKYSNLDFSSRKVFGHQLNDFITNCTFNGEPCSIGYFSYFQSLRYGNCFTFNKFSKEDDTVLTTSLVGVMSGLDVTMNFDPENYLSVTSSIGARVIVHDPRNDPNPEEEGVNISPGFETTLSMKQISISRLPAPYKDQCVTYGKDETIRGNNRDECVKFCIQEQNYAHCACIDPTLPSFKDFKNCNMTDHSDVCCLDTTLNDLTEQGLPCNCPLSCYTTAYDLKLSTAIWPSELNYFESYCSKCKENRETLRVIRQKQARLKVYYSKLENTIYEQKAKFQDSELFSHLGGQMGLWLGVSIVAAFEVIENLLYLCKYCVKQKIK